MRRFVLQQDTEKLYQYFAQKAVEIYNEAGEVAPQLFAVTLTEDTGEVRDVSALPPKFVQQFYQSGGSKDMLGHLIKALLKETSPLRATLAQQKMPLPDVVVQIAETWTTPLAHVKPEDCEATIERLSREGLSRQPDRQEAVLVALHTEDGSVVGLCPIENKRAVYAELKHGLEFSGRFAMQPDGPRH